MYGGTWSYVLDMLRHGCVPTHDEYSREVAMCVALSDDETLGELLGYSDVFQRDKLSPYVRDMLAGR